MKKNDIITIVVVIILSLIGYIGYQLFKEFSGGQNEGAQVEVIIKDNGEVIKTYPFNDNTNETFEYVDGDEVNLVVIKDGKVTVTEANCRDQICVKTRSISQNGEIIVCLPHKFSVEIFSEDVDDSVLDGVVD